MKWLGDNPFHTILLLTERPAKWAIWQIAPLPLVLAATAGFAWAWLAGDPVMGVAVAVGLSFFNVVDLGLLAALPRWGLSFGPPQPPWLALIGVRWLLALTAALFAPNEPLAALLVLTLVQVLLSLLAAYATLIEPFRLQVSQVEVCSPKLSNPGSPLRLVQLSDLHVERLTARERALPALVNGLKPDLIVLTGDYLSTTYHADPHALADLRALLGQLHAPGGVYAIWGTAEVDIPAMLRPILTDSGITILEDRAIELVLHAHTLWLMGLSCSPKPPAAGLEADAAQLRTLVRGAPSGAFTLLLYHRPDLMPQAAAAGVDLYLAGHTHGGQLRLPGFGAVVTASRYWKRYEAGAYQQGETLLYVSRGLGMEGFGAPRARFLSRPEVVLLTLQGDDCSVDPRRPSKGAP
jgi:predicted MPP superfamily phosphohydrolase